MKMNANQEFIVAGGAGITGILILIMTGSRFMEIAKEHSSVSLFMLGLALLFISYGFWSPGVNKRTWL